MALPRNDHDFAIRWRLVKSYFTRACAGAEAVCPTSRSVRKERSVWQRRFWEHWIRDQADWRRHVDYVHYNPVKHGYAARAADWRPSSIHGYIRDGVYPRDWGACEPQGVVGMELE
jgi:putative transposase